jgi:hypothetical protein
MSLSADPARTPDRGRAEAEDLDRRLRAIEEEERAGRLEGGDPDEAVNPRAYHSTADVARLTSRVEELAAFRRAVMGSFVWRTAQSVRRLVGREW